MRLGFNPDPLLFKKHMIMRPNRPRSVDSTVPGLRPFETKLREARSFEIHTYMCREELLYSLHTTSSLYPLFFFSTSLITLAPVASFCLKMKSFIPVLSVLLGLTAAAPADLRTRQTATSNDLANGKCSAVSFVMARGSTEPGNMVRRQRHWNPASRLTDDRAPLLDRNCAQP
jgi:hypothetical protein